MPFVELSKSSVFQESYFTPWSFACALLDNAQKKENWYKMLSVKLIYSLEKRSWGKIAKKPFTTTAASDDANNQEKEEKTASTNGRVNHPPLDFGSCTQLNFWLGGEYLCWIFFSFNQTTTNRYVQKHSCAKQFSKQFRNNIEEKNEKEEGGPGEWIKTMILGQTFTSRIPFTHFWVTSEDGE